MRERHWKTKTKTRRTTRCVWLTLVYAYTHTAAILAGSSLGSLTPLTGLRRLPAALLFPHLLLSLPLALTLWALAEWGFWRLAGDRKG